MIFLIQALQFAIFLYMLLLFARIVIGFVMAFSRDWRPAGVMLVIVEGVFTLTDPPLRFLRRFIPPLTVGRIRIDLAFLILFFSLTVISNGLNLLLVGMT